MKNLNLSLKLKNLLYIFQSENYSPEAFLAWTKRHRERFGLEKKKALKWTLKAKLIFGLSLILIALGLLFLVSLTSVEPLFWFLVIVFVGVLFFGPVEYFLVVSNFLLIPLDRVLRGKIIAKAKKKLEDHPDLIIVAVTGSYGKTTTTRFLTTILSEKYKVLSGASSFNTPLGVSRVILEELTKDHQVLVVEMGADHPGDIKELCEIVKPQIGIITGINEAHLEKFKTIETTIATKFELADALPDSGFLVINGSDENVRQNYQKHVHSQLAVYAGPDKKEGWSYCDYQFDGSGINFKITNDNVTYLAETRAAILGRHNIDNIMLAVMVANHLGLKAGEINKGIGKIVPVEHRLALKFNPNGITIIDDSYNGNPDGVRAALQVLSEFKEGRKIFFTPGLVEVGEARERIHVELGRQIAAVADLVILTKNSNTPYFLDGFNQANYPKEKIIVFNTSQEAYNGLGEILKSGDVIVFQNDWTDNYD